MPYEIIGVLILRSLSGYAGMSRVDVCTETFCDPLVISKLLVVIGCDRVGQAFQWLQELDYSIGLRMTSGIEVGNAFTASPPAYSASIHLPSIAWVA